MSALVETMMYANAVPWHGLGQKVAPNISCREAIKAAGLNWTVAKIRGSVVNPVLLSREDIAAHAIVRISDGRVLGTVGDAYSPVQNSDAFDFFDPIVKAGDATLEAAGSLKCGSVVWILAKITACHVEVASRDAMDRYYLLSNTHDGSKALTGGETDVRVVCWNTLSAAFRTGLSHDSRLVHRGDMQSKLLAVRTNLIESCEHFKNTAAMYRVMAGKVVSRSQAHDYFRRVFEVEDTEGDNRAVKATLDRWYMPIGSASIIPTVWGAYNAVTEYTSHGRMKDSEKRLTSVWFGDSARVNSRALELAVSL